MTGLVIEKMRQIVSGRTGTSRSRSASPMVAACASVPPRDTSTWQPAIFPASTYRVRRWSSIRPRRAGSNPAPVGSTVRSSVECTAAP